MFEMKFDDGPRRSSPNFTWNLIERKQTNWLLFALTTTENLKLSDILS